MSKTRLEKHTVCTSCYAVGIEHADCVCTYQKDYPTVELEFEVCECCGQLISDGSPADTEFNDAQMDRLRTNAGREKSNINNLKTLQYDNHGNKLNNSKCHI